jgi:coenzyme F420-reducing hydrogenase beta subunit
MKTPQDNQRPEARYPSFPSKEDCSGCGSCVESCPAKALSLVPDSEGFLYPNLNPGKCLSCGRCSRVCPVLHPPASVPPLSCLAARSADSDIRKVSSSGGVFAELAKIVLSKGGIVYGAAMDFPECTTRHVYIKSIDDLPRIQGSKYVQGNASDRFPEIQEFLKNGETVLFSGLPCQTAALASFLGAVPPNLILVDLICHGAPSPDVFLQYRNELLNRVNGIRVLSLAFRDKQRGWGKTSSTWRIERGSDILRLEDDLFVKAFSLDLFSRPSCHRCAFRSFATAADITLGDYWDGKNAPSDWDDETGISVALLHSTKGQELFLATPKVVLPSVETTLVDILCGNSSLVRSFSPNRCRRLFFFLRKRLSFRLSVRLSLGIDYLLSLPGHLRPSALRKRFGRRQK